MKITDQYIDVLTEGEWWDYIPDDSSDMELRLLERAVKEMTGIASRLTYCGECGKRLMTYMGRTAGEKSLNTLKSEEQKEKELKEKIDAHSKWLRNAGGERLNLAGADLQGMDN